MLLNAVPVLKPHGQASTGVATGEEFTDVRNTVQVDFSDIQDETQFGSCETKVEVSHLKQHIIDVS